MVGLSHAKGLGRWMAGAAVLAVLAGCDNSPPAGPTDRPGGSAPGPRSAAGGAAAVTPQPTVQTVSDFSEARKSLDEKRAKLPALASVLPAQQDGVEGLSAVGARVMELARGPADNLAQVQAIFNGWAVPRAEFDALLGAEAAKQWTAYQQKADGFFTMAEFYVTQIKSGKFDAVQVTELSAADARLLPAQARLIKVLGDKTPVYELAFVLTSSREEDQGRVKFKTRRALQPMVYVNGQWRMLMGVFTAAVSEVQQPAAP